MTTTPVRPTFALSIGVIGHRPNRLPEAARASVERRIGEMLASLRQAAEATRDRYHAFFADAPARLTLISALAEGADRMAAQAALRDGLTLASALPFPVADYETDFADPASRIEYAELIAKSARTLVLPGDHDADPRDYEAVGRLILDNADIVLAVWDGGPSGGRGGTTDLVERAAAMGLPIIHIDALDREPPGLRWAGLADFPVTGGAAVRDMPLASPGEVLGDVIDTLGRPPSVPGERAKLARFLAERAKKVNWRLEVPLILAVLGLRGVRRTDLLPASPDQVAAALRRVVPGLASPNGADRNAERFGVIADAYGAADTLAVREAQIFRGAYVSTFVFSALAVVTAALDLVGEPTFNWHTWPLAVLQMVFIILVIANTSISRWRDWHGRWRDAREAAERLRAAVPLWLLGQGQRDGAGAEPSWPGWYVRAHLRALGLWSGSLDRERLEAVRHALMTLVDDQNTYHAGVAAFMERVERRILRIGEVLFVLTLVIGAIDLLMAFVELDLGFNWRYPLIGLTAALPALGAATLGVRLIGDFEGAAHRSARTAAQLAAIGEALRQDPPELAVLRSRAASLADVMLGDVAHWRMATETRKVDTPI